MGQISWEVPLALGGMALVLILLLPPPFGLGHIVVLLLLVMTALAIRSIRVECPICRGRAVTMANTAWEELSQKRIFYRTTFYRCTKCGYQFKGTASYAELFTAE
jgi:hypothetical protein